uniref:Uncharacterized protein n=1 Tax=Cucumis melo TaxID=3656 RepID=A0A9I9DW82_CUCME
MPRSNRGPNNDQTYTFHNKFLITFNTQQRLGKIFTIKGMHWVRAWPPNSEIRVWKQPTKVGVWKQRSSFAWSVGVRVRNKE